MDLHEGLGAGRHVVESFVQVEDLLLNQNLIALSHS